MMSAERLVNYAARVGRVDLPVGHDDHELKRPDPFPFLENEDVPLPEDYTPTKRKSFLLAIQRCDREGCQHEI